MKNQILLFYVLVGKILQQNLISVRMKMKLIMIRMINFAHAAMIVFMSANWIYKEKYMTEESRARARMTIYGFLEGKGELLVLKWWMIDTISIVNYKMDMYFSKKVVGKINPASIGSHILN